ncbi:MAG: thioesterase family protein [Rhodovibrionaceae bacterium]
MIFAAVPGDFWGNRDTPAPRPQRGQPCPAPPPPTPEDFPAWTADRLRYCDTDRQGHINNAVFATFCESGRTSLLFEEGAPISPPGTAWVIARLELDFRSELNWPGEVEIGTAVKSIGGSSIVLRQGMFKDGVCAADAQTVIVLMDEASRKSAPLPPELRARLEKLKA